jgi:hypothetical protein
MACGRSDIGIFAYHKAIPKFCQRGNGDLSLQRYVLVPLRGHFLLIHFEGTRITVYGTTPTTTGPETVASIDFLIDGVHSNTFTGPQRAEILEHTAFFHVDGLSNNREHIVTMNALTSNLWYLDYMVYTTQNSALAGGGGSQDAGGVSPNVGAIVGGVIAGIVAIMGLLSLGFICLRRRRAQRDLANPRPATESAPGPLITPFNSAFEHNYGPARPSKHAPTGNSIPFRNSSASNGDSSAYTGYSSGRPVGSSHTEMSSSIPQPISAAQDISYV